MIKYEINELLTTTLIVELIFLTAFRFRKPPKGVGRGLKWKSINSWYSKLKWSAFLLDILSILIGFYISIYLYNYLLKNKYIDGGNEIIHFLIILLIVQITHDVLFYNFIIKPAKKGQSDVMDEFIDYADIVGINAIIGDSLMYILSIPILYFFVKKNDKDLNRFLSIISLYFIGYLLYKK